MAYSKETPINSKTDLRICEKGRFWGMLKWELTDVTKWIEKYWVSKLINSIETDKEKAKSILEHYNKKKSKRIFYQQ